MGDLTGGRLLVRAPGGAEVVIDGLLRLAADWSGTQPPHDDVTLSAMRVR